MCFKFKKKQGIIEQKPLLTTTQVYDLKKFISYNRIEESKEYNHKNTYFEERK
jgi:hypothetical protein